MKNSFKIFKRDLVKVAKNPVALIIIGGLCILPSLYAWFNIRASWDPYGNTVGISVAVVNNDKGGSLEGKDLNIGNDIVDKLKENTNIGWKFVNKEDAEYGLTHNKYYAYIEIPEDFSADISTLLSDNPIKPELIYKVNEKSNAIAPKITDKGASTIIQEVTATFVDTVNKSIFEGLNTVASTLDENKPKLLQLKAAIISINDNMASIKSSIDKAQNGAIDLNAFLKDLEKNIPLMNDSISKLEDVTISSKDLVSLTQTELNTAIDSLKFKLEQIQLINEDVQTLVNNLKEVHTDVGASADKIVSIIDGINGKLSSVKTQVDSSLSFLQKLHDKFPGNDNINKQIEDLTKIKGLISSESEKLNNLKNTITSGQQVSTDITNFLDNTTKEIQQVINNKVNQFESTIRPAINDIANKLTSTADNINTILNNAKSSVPKLEELIKLGKDGANLGINVIGDLKDVLPEVETSISNVSSKLSNITDEDLNKLISILRNDPTVMGDYISSPIVLKEDRVFQIPNYGSAMTPFYTILALWVGVLLLSSILKTEVELFEDGTLLTENEKYFGRFLTFLTLAIIQSLIVSLGDKYILGAYVVNIPLFIGFCVFSSIIFTLIVYTLVSVFGNVGKAIAVILLVLQVAGSGGTFPIEVTPQFFQKLQPFLPFTYAIGALREAVAGPLVVNLKSDILAMLGFGIVFLIIGILFKKPLSHIVEKLHHKFKECGLSE